MNKKISSIVKRFLAVALVAAIAFSNPISVEAKTKSKTLKSVKSFETTTSIIDANATPVSKGNYKFKLKKIGYDGRAYIKFTAPATKTYKFTLNNLRSNNGKYACGFYYIMKTDPNHPEICSQTDVQTKGGNRHDLFFASKKTKDKQFITKRTASVPLTQGETIYVHFNASGILSKYVTFNFSIK
ncbi:hypothetical protein [Butyrivibrio sp. AE3004]|uniref:hypothetical protein n=1 Tax=Butyrivibrio sp. AE3004 TaxID=1506994 RepID=UPI0004946294|nr:hypothetical protein [Butyrivibrio sp. AE3004]